MAACREGSAANGEGTRHMTDRNQLAINPAPADLSDRRDEAINNPSLGIVIFDDKREVVFCNRRYMQMYRMLPEQETTDTRISALIQHRVTIAVNLRVPPDDYNR